MLKTDTSLLDNIIIGRVDPHIYAFTTETIPNYLKIGDTYRPVDERLGEWRKYFSNLKLQYKHIAKTEDGKIFRDYSVHLFLETEKDKERLKKDTFANVHYSNEFFKDTSPEDVEEAIADIRDNARRSTGKYQLYSPDRLPTTFHYERNQTFPLRPNQKDTVNNFVAAVSKGRNNLLMYAVMRFGKSFTAMHCSKALDNCRLTLIVSAKADVRGEWKKTVESHVAFSDYVFLDKDDLSNDESVIADSMNDGKRVAVFLTLQDLAGNSIKARHREIFASEIDLLIVDETHYGARASRLGRVLQSAVGLTTKEQNSELKENDSHGYFEENDIIVKSLHARVKLHLSGTPYRILMGDEFTKDDIIAFCQFTDIVDLQHKWDAQRLKTDECGKDGKETPEWENPYFGFPQMIRFAFKPNASSLKKLRLLKEQGHTFAMSELFRPCSILKDARGNYKRFKHEREVLDLLTVIDGTKEDENILGFLEYDKIKEGKMCRHMVFVLPYRASCDAMEALIKANNAKFKNLSAYDILNISGVGCHSLSLSNETICQRIKDSEAKGKKTITLTVNRMLTGSTVEQWDTMLFLKDTASPQEYDQAIFRLQNQFIKTFVDETGETIKFNMKPQTLLVDFDPDRMFRMQELKSQFYNANTDSRGNENLEQRISKELEISPIITLNHNKLSQVTPANIMDAVRNYSLNKSIVDESMDIPFDANLLDISAFRNEIESLNNIDSSKGIEIKPITDEDVDDLELPDNNTAHENNGGEKSDNSAKDKKSDADEKGMEKKFATYCSKVLLFAFMTDAKVSCLNDIISLIRTDNESHRIARNLGLRLTILCLLQEKANVFVLSKLDYKIQSINEFTRDQRLTPVDRSRVAMSKFARLSNSEVVTPMPLADELVGLIPQDDLPENAVFLDITSVEGEMACALFNKYGNSVINSVFSVATSPLTYELTRKVYKMLGMPVDHVFTFNSYDLIKEENGDLTKQLKDIAPDVVCGVPPFSEKAGGGRGDGGTSIYHKFFNYAKRQISPRFITMMTPSSWYNGGRGEGLHEFRDDMLSERRVKEFHDYPNVEDYIKGATTLRGGICLFLWDSQYCGDCMMTNRIHHNDYVLKRPLRFCHNGFKADFLIRWNKGLTILDKVLDQETRFITDNGMMRKRNAFGFIDDSSDEQYAEKRKSKDRTVKVYLAKGRKGYASESCFKKEKGAGGLLGRWKVLVAKSSSGADEIPHNVISDPIVSEPNSVTAHTHYVIDGVNSKDEAKNLALYMKTRFVRFLIFLLRNNQNMRVDMYQFVPRLDFSKKWTDTMLFKKYGLDKEEIEYIKMLVKQRK